jgi:integrase
MWERMRETQADAPRRHPREALTPRKIAATSAPGRHADGRGLYLFVGPTGAKSWVLRVKVKHGTREDVGLGSVADVSLANAREAARRWRSEAKAGRSPVALKRAEHDREKARLLAPAFEQAARDYHALHAHTFRNDKHRKQWLSSLTPVFAAFGATRVDDVRSNDIINALEARWLHTPETARRTLQRIRAVFEWARAKQFCAGENPTKGLEKVLPRQGKVKQHHAALAYAELPAFIQALRASDAGMVVRLAFEFLILTGARTSEVLNAPWSEFDLDAKTWTIPGARMKAGIEHRVPLSPRCLELLTEAQALSDGGPFVFPGRKRGRPLSNMAFLMCLRRLHRDAVTPHGFRSCFRDWVEEKTHTPRAVAEAALAHTVRDKTEAAYKRTTLFDRRRDLMRAWATFATATPAKVVRMRA